ncbi:hypothetical protein VN12_13645 [Pirellula sp. SH-Sr6A]|uniref:hypothetical protein n=1 Tax=Pirellula sp. SH-Sr6A TaxID=1632865 RepID=UPI00078B3820|nr:hypothetical protein [Pirellula sp. SH-Sr6A]AMV33164.1 hypothetical protein VN12_13645 [Pirellula sp. SH-Sr6A]
MHFQRRRKHLWLHESTQRALYRSVLLLLGLIPLLATSGFVVLSKTSWYQLRQAAAWRERIRSNIGLDVVFQSIEQPSPHTFRIRELVCAHPETQTPILRAEQVDGVMTNEGWALKLHAAEIKQEQSNLALQILHDSFLCRPHNLVPILKVSIDSLRILPSTLTNSPHLASAPKLESLHQIQIEYTPSLSLSDIKILFGLEPKGSETPGLVHVRRYHDPKHPHTDWAIDTRDLAIPCSAIQPYFPVVEHVGPLALFRGQVRWEQDAQGWQSTLHQSTFLNTSWAALSHSIGEPLQGFGDLHIEEAILRNGLIDRVQGSISAGSSHDETIQVPWLKQTMERFGWCSHDLRPLQSQTASVDSMELAFHLDGNGLRWRGNGPGLSAPGAPPSHSQIGSVKQILLATDRALESKITSLDEVSRWLATGPDATQAAELVQRWHSRLVSLLPTPSNAARLSGVPNTIR